MVEATEVLIETVRGGQVLVAIAKMIFAELAGGIAFVLEERGDGGVARLPSFLGAGQTHLGHAGAHGHGAAEKGGAAGGATLLTVVVGEAHAFTGNAVDIGRHVTHHAAIVETDIPGADVVAPE